MMSVKDKELETVVGGTQEEIDEIIAVFRKHGFNAEADKLAKSGTFFFADRFNEILKGLGYTQRLEILQSDSEDYNFNIYNGYRVGNMKFIEILDEFLYRKANGIEWWQ